jgi:type IV secretion system protein VirB2
VATVASSVYAQTPFDTGATTLINDFQLLAVPIAALVVIALGVAALAGRISWGWPVAAIAGIAIIFGAQNIVEWVRSAFA